MMRSNFTDDEDDFAPNPFRDSNNFAPQPQQPQQQQHQNPYAQQQQQQQLQQQQYHQQNQQQQQYHQQQQFNTVQPDPNSGMIGSLPGPSMMINNNISNYTDPSQYLSGPMDQGAMHHYNNNHNNMNNNNAANRQTQSASSQQQPPQQQVPFSFLNYCLCCTNLDASSKQLFDVDTTDVVWRVRAALTQFYQPDYFRLTVVGDTTLQAAANAGTLSPSSSAMVPVADRKGPDLYGPVWLGMTLMFALAGTANIHDSIRHGHEAATNRHSSDNSNNSTAYKPTETVDAEFEYDLTHLMNAMYLCFVYTFGLPTCFWLASQCLGLARSNGNNGNGDSLLPWSTWVCLYGYSTAPLVVAALLAGWFRWAIVHWVLLGGAVAASALLIVRNVATPLLTIADVDTLHPEQLGSTSAKAAPLLLSILGSHFCVLLVLKFSFYS